jgi:hypothetical protein
MSARKPAKAAAKPVPPEPGAAGGRAAPADDASAGDTSALALTLAGEIDRAFNEGRTEVLSEAAVQALMAVACRSYSDRSRVASTDVMVTASGLLKAANLAVFELGMWQSWTGR